MQRGQGDPVEADGGDEVGGRVGGRGSEVGKEASEGAVVRYLDTGEEEAPDPRRPTRVDDGQGRDVGWTKRVEV